MSKRSGLLPLLRDFGGSLAGRIALVLTLGVASASIASLFLAEQLRILELERLQLERVTASSADMADRFSRDAAATQRLIDRNELFGVSGPCPPPASPRPIRACPKCWPSVCPPPPARRCGASPATV
jgi:hypothetical protein